MDLDILLFGDVVQDTPGLVLPRPDLLKWAFMLGPLAELVPELVHPVMRQTLSALWAKSGGGPQGLAPMSIQLSEQ
jgi:2-amino-4-hydroxy-6-hydroxymethyldihydropteridine diphosphokinase